MNTYAERGAPNTGVPGKGKRRYGKGMNGVYSIEIRGRGKVGTRGARRCRAPAADGSRGGQDAQKVWVGRPDSRCEWEWVKTWEVCFIFFQIEKGKEIVYKKETTSFCCRLFRDLHFFLLTCE